MTYRTHLTFVVSCQNYLVIEAPCTDKFPSILKIHSHGAPSEQHEMDAIEMATDILSQQEDQEKEDNVCISFSLMSLFG